MRKFLKAAFLFATVIMFSHAVFSASSSAQAVSTKVLSIDCSANYAPWGNGQVYLFPGESVQIDFEDCESSIYIDVDSDPNAFTPSVTRSTGDGRITFSSDGTFVVSANVTSGVNQGQWYSPNGLYSYLWFDELINSNSVGYLKIMLVGDDVSTITGKQLISTSNINFPTTITTSNQFRGDSLLAACIDYDAAFPNERFVFVETPLEVSTAGDFSLRTISTTPVSGFTNYLNNPIGNFEYFPVLDISHLIYSDFDPNNPTTGFMGCASENAQGGNYLSIGEVLDSSYAQLDISLPVGHYTVVSAYIYAISAQDWNTPQYWSVVPELSVTVQIWGPEQRLATAAPTLAATGIGNMIPFSAFFITVGMLFVAVSIVRIRRVKRAPTD